MSELGLRRIPRGIIFDFDDTLVDARAAYQAGLAAVGLSPAMPAYRAARREVKRQLPVGQPASHQRLLYLQSMQRRGLLPAVKGPRALLALVARYEQCVAKHMREQWRILGRAKLFGELSKVAALCVLTNETTRTQLTKWAGIDPAGRYFQFLLASEEVGYDKPNEAGFQLAAKRLRCQPKDCLMVGDNLATDILPALALGMQVILTREFSAKPRPPIPRTQRQQIVQVAALAELAVLSANA